MKYSDRPISRPRDDLLGRAKFALSLARAIGSLRIAKDGFVIAIMGEWGSGKSSVVEMVSRYLLHLEMQSLADSEEKTLSSIEELAEVYDRIRNKLRELADADLDIAMAHYEYRQSVFARWLGNNDEAILADKYLTLLNKVQAAPSTIQIRFSPWMIAGRAELTNAFLSDLARTLGDKLGQEVREPFARLLQRISELAPIAGTSLDLATGTGIGKLITSGGSWAGKLGERLTSGPTLDELREKLRKSLNKIDGRRILVMIDDLDRLTPSEAVEMVSLVKSLGDLPNVVYLLSFDRKNLAKLLEEGNRIDGHEYLEKIVQYPINLPPIEANGLSRLLNADLTEIFGSIDPPDARRLSFTWHFAFRHYLKTPRQVRLYANSMAIAVPSQRDFVDLVDLALVEVLRLHEPDLYNWLRENLEELTE
ncbi:P-loop NTPase fold protein [Bradyrhizobium sp. SZCCHNR2026]|uniref:KAP family P-loop NTPase fold protein n=1 Tax=Bradyrhizobium sp. SZCCHNR2026 TaxID=3057381 RepID=UPI002915DB34|nr:P-loop NTPase fold protein [Bradyrhizobium sp. SZCCHNR2026]